jgi:hypothetical protein
MWGWLKPLAKIGASFIPGGSAVMDAVSAGSEMLGGGAKAAKEGRMDEATLQTRINEGNNRAQLEAGTFNAKREGDLMRRALAAKMVGGMQPPSDPRAKFGGGQVDPVMQQLLARYGGMADQDVMGGGYKLTPTMSGIPKSGLMEKIGGTAGTVGGILGMLGGLKQRPQPEEY